MTTELPNWLHAEYQRLASALAAHRLSHALLITGGRGVGKQLFADRLQNHLACDQPLEEGPCGSCRSCQLVAAGSHPDVRRIAPADDGKPITVEQIRDLIAQGVFSTEPGRHRSFVLTPADSMNTASANALLKMLEEPVPGVVLILLSANPDALPATVRSRCAQVSLRPPRHADAVAWLQEQGLGQPELLLAQSAGMPLRALELASDERWAGRAKWLDGLLGLLQGQTDAVQLAAQWKTQDLSLTLTWLQHFLHDMVRLRVSDHAARLFNPDRAMQFSPLAQGKSLPSLLKLQQVVLSARAGLRNNLNPTMLLEHLLVQVAAGWSGEAD